jgi:hypothetical protein
VGHLPESNCSKEFNGKIHTNQTSNKKVIVLGIGPVS